LTSGLASLQIEEVQGTGAGATFCHDQLQQLLELAATGIGQLQIQQRQALGSDWPF